MRQNVLNASNSQTISSTKKQRIPKHSVPSEPSDQNTKLLALAEQVAHFGSWEWDVSKPRAVWSTEMFRIFGLEPQAEGLTLEEFRSFIHPDDLEAITRKMQNAFTGSKLNQKSEINYRIFRHDGSIRIIHSQRQVKELTEEGKLKVVVGVDQDVTEQWLATKLSTENSKLLALAEEVAHFGSWELNTGQPRAKWSPGMFSIFGVTPRAQGFNWEEYLSFIHPDDREAANKNAQTMLNASLNHRESFDYRIIRPNGEVRVINSQRQVKEVDAKGKSTVVFGVDQDVTEQKHAEESLKKSEERFRAVAEAANVMVYETDVESGKVRILQGLEQLMGFKPEEVDASVEWVLSRMHPDDTTNVMETFNDAINNPSIDRYVLEYRVLHKNDKYIIVKDTAKAIKNGNGKTLSFIGGIRDITQRRLDQEKLEQYSKHLEELVKQRTKQLLDYERLAAIGQVAGMVGHDIRNPLQALISELYLIKTELADLPQNQNKQNITESIDSAEQNISYINKIVADLQDYSRKLNPEYQQVDLEDLIVNVFKTISIPNKIQLSFNIKPLPKLTVDPIFLQRALTNLVNNAIQAMPNGGKLEISGSTQDGFVCLTIADTGVGISEEVKTKLFTPMFTTKAKGQGLGLAVVKRLVEAQGGSIGFESALGVGTKFLIKIPLIKGRDKNF
jgi:PAS domain S-box-containing protein